jgi:AraC family transcriptional regulator, regulatory protein of adaptative response / methylated-DNA-[protein]-cysteine methyltransferase
MDIQKNINYNRIAGAIKYIRENFRNQPSLGEIAQISNLSPFHFQRMFSEWAGTTPKKFLQYISLEYAKKILKDNQASLADTAEETGLSGSSRLHDLFINIEGMTPAEYRNGGQDLAVNYSFAESPFGDLIIASTTRGVCYMAFQEDEIKALTDLVAKFPNASFTRNLDLLQQKALFIFQNDWSKLHDIKLHLKGTGFQLKVWESLLKIPMGQLYTYGMIAHNLDKPGASRAVGTAVGSNPVAFLIPCHRVIQSSGSFGDYMWGRDRKTALIGWEAAKTHEQV